MRLSGVLTPLLVLAALSGCSDDATTTRRPAALGAATPTPATPPEVPMDRLEEPVAERLAPRLARQGLDLEYVDCPPWTGTVPHTAVCDGYVDGVVGEVEVRLFEGDHGRVEFDARLSEGVVATLRLVDRLEREGWNDVDCGSTPAYPARPGLEIVCRVHQGGTADYLVATVTGRAGAVRIEDY